MMGLSVVCARSANPVGLLFALPVFLQSRLDDGRLAYPVAFRAIGKPLDERLSHADGLRLPWVRGHRPPCSWAGASVVAGVGHFALR